MSNRDRIAQLRAEADAAAKEKEAARAAKASAPGKSAGKKSKAAKPAGRVRMVWSVCNSAGKPVETFPYAQEREAIAAAAALTESSGRPHFVTKGEEPVE